MYRQQSCNEFSENVSLIFYKTTEKKDIEQKLRLRMNRCWLKPKGIEEYFPNMLSMYAKKKSDLGFFD